MNKSHQLGPIRLQGPQVISKWMQLKVEHIHYKTTDEQLDTTSTIPLKLMAQCEVSDPHGRTLRVELLY